MGEAPAVQAIVAVGGLLVLVAKATAALRLRDRTPRVLMIRLIQTSTWSVLNEIQRIIDSIKKYNNE